MNEEFTDPAARILLECARLIEKKSADYNSGFSRDDYALWGRKSHIQSIHTKYLRLRSLCDTEHTPHFESLCDTLMDLACYSAIAIDWERRHGSK